MKIIDFLITRGVLKATTFAKRHPLTVLLLLVALILLPPIGLCLTWLATWFGGRAWGTAIGKLLLKASDLMVNKPHVWWIFLWVLSLIFPLLAALLALWTVVSYFKRATLQIIPTAPAPPPVSVPTPSAASTPTTEAPWNPLAGTTVGNWFGFGLSCLLLFPLASFGADNVISGLAQGNTVFVDATLGRDGTGQRNNPSRPYRTPLTAVNMARAGDVVAFAPGQYNCGTNNILKAGVNYFVPSGAVVTWTNLDLISSQSYQGLFDDRLTGPTTNYIFGAGKFVYDNQQGTACRGMFVVTNSASEIHFQARRVEGRGDSALPFGGCGSFFALMDGKTFIEVDEVQDLGQYILDDLDTATNGPSIRGVYWEKGQHQVGIRRLVMQNGYGLWGHDPATNSVSDFWYTGDLVDAGSGTAAFYEDVPNFGAANGNFKSWLTVKELRATNTIGISLIGLSKVYISTEKVSGNPAVGSSALLWLTAQKITGSPAALSILGGDSYISVLQYEQGAGQASPFIDLAGGSTRLIGGYVKATNAQSLITHEGGTNVLDGITLDTRGASGTAYPLNVKSNYLTLKDVAIYSGTSNAIFSAGPFAVTTLGSLSIDRAVNTNLTVSGAGPVYAGRAQRRFHPDMADRRSGYGIHGGINNTWTAVGDAVTLVTSALGFGVGPEANSGSGVYLNTFGTAFDFNGVSGNTNYRAGRFCTSETRCTLTNISSVIFWAACLTDGSITNQMTNSPAFSYAGFRFSTLAGDGNFKFVTANAGTQTVTDTGVPADTGNHLFQSEEDSFLNQWFGYIDEKCVATNSTNIPVVGTNLRYVEGVKTLSGVTNGCKWEWFFSTAKK